MLWCGDVSGVVNAGLAAAAEGLHSQCAQFQCDGLVGISTHSALVGAPTSLQTL